MTDDVKLENEEVEKTKIELIKHQIWIKSLTGLT